MIDKDKSIRITSRSVGRVGYTIPDLGNLHRNFEPGETKEITFNELQKLSWINGGRYMIKNLFIIEDEEALHEVINSQVEPEYYYTEETITELLNTGTVEQLADCLDYAPQGVRDLIKKIATQIELSDIRKRNIIQSKTGYNINKAIEINKQSQEAEAESEQAPQERKAPVFQTSASTTSKYKVISK